MLGSIWRSIKFLTPSFNRALSKFGYEMAAKNFQFEDWRFMNFGYVYENDKDSPVLEKTDELDRYFIQLYDHLIKDLNVENKKILEVGSGRGGGANYISKYYKPLSYVGIDISQNAIDFSNRVNNIDTLSFEQGDAENLSFKDQTFDIVINVESSHCYGSFDKFLSEVFRVLPSDGYFAFTDIMTISKWDEIEKIINNSKFRKIYEKDISQNALNSLTKVSEWRKTWLEDKFPSFVRGVAEDISAVKGTRPYNKLESGKLIYKTYLFVKD